MRWPSSRAEQKDVAARLFNHLVTPSGTKIAHEVSDLADFGQVSIDGAARRCCRTLSERRILRSLRARAGDARYEIFHDVLARAGARVAGRGTRRSASSSVRSAARTVGTDGFCGLVVGAAVLLAVDGRVTVYALVAAHGGARAGTGGEGERARRERRRAARARPGAEPPARAARRRDGLERRSERALRRALLASRVARSSTSGRRVLDATCARRRRRRGHRRRERSTATPARRCRPVGADGRGARDASFAEDGTALVTGRDGRVRTVGSTGVVEVVPGVDAATARRDLVGCDACGRVEPGALASSSCRPDGRSTRIAHRGARSAAISPDNRRV